MTAWTVRRAKKTGSSGPWTGYALALAIGWVSGTIAVWAGVPLPWMLGPMIGTMVAGLARIPMLGPAQARNFVIPILGVMLGSRFSPEVIDQVGSWAVTIALMPIYIVCVCAVGYLYFSRVVGYSRETAYFSAMPGGLNEMLVLGAEAGADERQVALAHASRILIVITSVAVGYGVLFDASVGGGGRPSVSLGSLGMSDYLWLLSCGLAGSVLGPMFGLPAGNLTGPLILSAAAHALDFVALPPPTIVSSGAQLVIGTIVGCRFVGLRPGDVLRSLAIGAGASFLMLLVSIAFAIAVHYLSGMIASQAVLAFAPGGITEMSLLALAMGENTVYISFSHILRVALVVSIAPLGFQLLRRWRA